MKKQLLALTVVLLALGLNAKAQTIYDNEPFSYPDGTPLYSGTAINLSNGQSPAAGEVWNAISSPTTNPLTVTGGALVLKTTGDDDTLSFASGGVATTVMSGSVYAGFDLNLSADTTPQGYFLAFDTAPTNTSSFSARVFAEASGSGYILGLSLETSTGTYQTVPTVLSFGTTYRVVVEDDLGTGADLYIAPTDAVQGDQTGFITLSGITDTSAGAVLIRQGSTGSSPSGTIDNLVVSNDFADAAVYVASVPEPSTYAALLGGLILVGVATHRRFAKVSQS